MVFLLLPWLPEGGLVPEKSCHLRRVTPRVTPGVTQHNSHLVCVPGGLNVTWDVLKALGGRVLAAMVVWEPKVVRNDSGGLGGSLFRGLCLSAPCWTTWVAFLGHNGSLFG